MLFAPKLSNTPMSLNRTRYIGHLHMVENQLLERRKLLRTQTKIVRSDQETNTPLGFVSHVTRRPIRIKKIKKNGASATRTKSLAIAHPRGNSVIPLRNQGLFPAIDAGNRAIMLVAVINQIRELRKIRPDRQKTNSPSVWSCQGTSRGF